MNNLPILSVSHVFKSFSNSTVLDGISFALKAGQCLALLGPNGAGKSTTIKICLGLDDDFTGTVDLIGFSIPEFGHLARQQVGVVPQFDSLDPDFTVFENLNFFARYFGIRSDEAASRARQLLDFASLTSRSDEAVKALSGGMRRRLMLARSLVNNPKLIFLDEPTSSLDPHARLIIWDRLKQLKQQGLAIFLTTHYMDEAENLADYVAILDHGHIIAYGTPKDLILSHVGEYVLKLWGENADMWVNKMVVQGKFSLCERRDNNFYFSGQAALRVNEILHSIRPAGIEYLFRPANLEDVFFSLTGRGLRDH